MLELSDDGTWRNDQRVSKDTTMQAPQHPRQQQHLSFTVAWKQWSLEPRLARPINPRFDRARGGHHQAPRGSLKANAVLFSKNARPTERLLFPWRNQRTLLLNEPWRNRPLENWRSGRTAVELGDSFKMNWWGWAAQLISQSLKYLKDINIFGKWDHFAVIVRLWISVHGRNNHKRL